MSKSKKTPNRKSAIRSAPSHRSRAHTARSSQGAGTVERTSGREEVAEKRGVCVDDFETDPGLDVELEIDDVAVEAVDLGGDDSELDTSPDTGMDGHIDDPVRMYLMQMGEIPLLTRAEEIASAKEIERTRTHFRHSMLASDYLLQGAVGLLKKVRDGKLRLDRTIEVSVTNTAEKKNLLKRTRPESQDAGRAIAAEPAGFLHGNSQKPVDVGSPRRLAPARTTPE